MNIVGSRAQKTERQKITGALEGHRRGPWVEYIARTESLFPPSGSISYSLASIRPHLHLWMLVLLPCCLQTSALPSVEAMEGPLSRTGGSPEPGPSFSTGSPQTLSLPRLNHYLLMDTQCVPCTVPVDEESQREAGVIGTWVQKKCLGTLSTSCLQRHSITHLEVKPFKCDAWGKASKPASPLEQTTPYMGRVVFSSTAACSALAASGPRTS